jgi:enoyl-[acyl-carrier protein] reductase III
MSHLSSRVIAVIAEVTRYPSAILTLDAALEDDLGIDSVKLAEILAVLGRELNLVGEPPRGSLRTIQDVVDVCSQGAVVAPVVATPVAPAPVVAAAPIVAAPASVAAPIVAAPKPVAAPIVAAPTNAFATVQDIVARVTRYPAALLTPDADLEDDLGIDSVKQAEVMVAIAEAFPAARELDVRRDGIRTLGALASRLTPAVVVPVAAPIKVAPIAPPPRVVRDLPFDGKVILVTGSGRGLGKSLALHLAAQGATVVVNAFHSRDAGIQTVAEIRAAGGKAEFAWGSVANEAHVDDIFTQIRDTFGRLDGLVCNASDGVLGSFSQVGPREWDRAFRTCVTGTHLCALRAADLMLDGGAIVTMSTITAHRYLRGFGSQGVVKAAVESLTRYLACELGPRGVRTNCVSAGPVYGDLLDRFPEADETIAHWERITPGGELTQPEDVAAVVEMLLGDRTARVNGAVWVVDNGVSVQIDGRVGAEPARTHTAVMRLSPMALAR